jgi:hypothetical protein
VPSGNSTTADAYGRFPLAYVADGTLLRSLIKSADGATTYFDRDNVLAPAQLSASQISANGSDRGNGFWFTLIAPCLAKVTAA